MSRYKYSFYTCLLLLFAQLFGCATPDGWAILASIGNKEITKVYIKKGIGLYTLDERGDTPFLWSARNGFPDMVDLMLSRKTNIDQRNESTGETALILATINKHHDVIELLIRKGANATIKDNIGKTALDWATLKGNQDSIKLLMPLFEQSTGNSSKNN